MTIDELKAAIERRGYEVREPAKEPRVEGYTTLYLMRGDEFLASTVSHADLETSMMGMSELAEHILSGWARGQQHMCCAHCNEPLLFSVSKVVVIRAVGYAREYRSAKAGPGSPVLRNCPGCGVVLSLETVQEIVDDADRP